MLCTTTIITISVCVCVCACACVRVTSARADFRDAAKECKNADKLSAELSNCADKYAAKAKAAKSKRG